jgi:hypothetical protein
LTQTFVTSEPVVVDDSCLRDLLLNNVSRSLRAAIKNREVFTTSTWLYRLCQAIRSSEVVGRLSGPITSLPDELQIPLLAKLAQLPPEIGLLSGRDLAWTMAGLVQTHRLNYLSLEGLASALVLNAPIVLSKQATSPLLVAACRAERVRVILVS